MGEGDSQTATSAAAAPKRAYWCFISYRHADNREAGREWATWLHHALETYQVPADLVGRTNDRGEVIPAQIFPVFRDEEELAGGHLKQGICDALGTAKSLVVLCSPRVLGSSYVDEEIRTYKRLRGAELRAGAKPLRAEPMAAILDGDPAAPAGSPDDCLPAALRQEVGEGGELTGRAAEESLWIDFRLPDGGQGWASPGAYREALERVPGVSRADAAARVAAYRQALEKAKLRLIAGILGVPLGELQKRDDAYRLAQARRRARALAGILAVVLVLAVAAAIGGLVAVQQRREAVRQRDLALARGEAIKKNAEWMNYDLRDILATYAPARLRVEATERLDNLVRAVEALPGAAAGSEPDDPEVLRARVAADLQKADAILSHAESDPAQARPLYENALRIARRLAAADPGNAALARDRAVACNKLGDAEMRMGRPAEARRLYEESSAATKQLVRLDPASDEYGRDLGIGYIKLGDADLRLGNPASARELYAAALAIAKRLEEIAPDDPRYRRDLAAASARLGDVELQLGALAAAKENYLLSLEAARALSEARPDVAQYRRDLGVSYNRLGDVELRLGNAPAAQEYFEKDLALAREQAASDPANAKYRRDLVASHARLGAFHESAGADAPALAHYRAVVAILQETKAAGALPPEDDATLATYREKIAELER